MNVNKKLGRFKQWAGEKMGGEAKTDTGDDFKSLEQEMTLRQDGMEKLQKSMNQYIKWMSKKADTEERGEKKSPSGYLGATMINHGEDFEPDSEFGNCLSSMGRANERIARIQENYVANATSTWLESLDRSLAQMTEYQAARKKLEGRRLTYDNSLAKMQKAKKEDFRVEEDLRAQKAKYEESNEDVYRRMEDIKAAEVDSIQDMTAFLDAQLAYFDKCREVLLQVKDNWPGSTASAPEPRSRGLRSRTNTASYSNSGYDDEENGFEDPRLSVPKGPARRDSPRREIANPPDFAVRPPYARANTHTPTSHTRDISPVPMPRLSRVPTEPTAILAGRAQLRSTSRQSDIFGDDSEGSQFGSETASVTSTTKRAPPPPPPSRAKKPPPPPPPMKRSALSSSEVPRV